MNSLAGPQFSGEECGKCWPPVPQRLSRQDARTSVPSSLSCTAWALHRPTYGSISASAMSHLACSGGYTVTIRLPLSTLMNVLGMQSSEHGCG